jgi:hypothetical protein
VENGKLEYMHYKIQTSNFNAIQRMCFCQTHLQLTNMEYGAYENFYEINQGRNEKITNGN